MSALPECFARLRGTQADYLYQKTQQLVDQGYSIALLGDELDTPLYAWAGLEEPDEIYSKVFKRGPAISWRFHVPGCENTSIIVKPVYRRITDNDRSDEGFKLIYRDRTGSHIFDYRHDLLLQQPGVSSSGFVDHSNHYLAIRGNQDIADLVRDFYYAFHDDPLAIFALESDRCCFCHKPLTDAKSRALGVGPDCFRGWEPAGNSRVAA